MSRDLSTQYSYFEMLRTMSSLRVTNFDSVPSSVPKLQPIIHFPQVNPLVPGLKLLEIVRSVSQKKDVSHCVACTQTLLYFSFRYFRKHRRAHKRSERARTSAERDTTPLRWRPINPLRFIFYHSRSTDFKEKKKARVVDSAYERGGDARRLAQRCKFRILVSLRVFWAKCHHIQP